jgi:hypothetical protein
MPDMPVLKKFPYDSGVPCKVCHPADKDDPPNLLCKMEIKREGTTVQRVLECPNCEARADDIWDPVHKRVMFNAEMDIAAARGPQRKKSGDLG